MLNFKEHYLGEAEISTTNRVAIPHLHHDKYPMDPKVFLDIVEFLKQNKNKVSPSNVHVSEKSDGAGWRAGLSEDGKFFIESSRSGPVFHKGHFREFSIRKHGVTNPISEGFEDLFNKLSEYKPFLDILKKYNKNGIKVVGEVFYLPTATKGPDNTVKFVGTFYKAEKIGAWASFVLFDVLDGKGKSLPNKDEIIDELKKISTKNIHFDDGKISDWDEIDVSQEVKEVKNFIKDVEKNEGKKIDEILSNAARDRNSMQAKSKLKAEIGVFQKKLHDKLSGIIKSGKWGDDYEGMVVKLANNIIFKITSEKFREYRKSLLTKKNEGTIIETPHLEIRRDDFIDFHREDNPKWILRLVKYYKQYAKDSDEITRNLMKDQFFRVAFKKDLKNLTPADLVLARRGLPQKLFI